MSTTGRSVDGVAGAESAAAAIRESGFVRVVSHAHGAGLAAAGVLARGLSEAGIGYQVSVARTDARAATKLAGVDESSASVAFGFDADELTGYDDAVSVTHATRGGGVVRDAASIVRELGASPFEPLVLAGLRSAGEVPTEDDGAFERRPGVGIPTEDLGDGLAHSTLLHGEFSGDESRAGATLAELGLPADLDESARRRVASFVSLDATTGPVPERTTAALQRALHPHVHPECEYATIEGLGDVLDALARHAPGLGVATAIGGLDRTNALEAWRQASEAVHTAVQRADASSESGDHVASCSIEAADPVAVARLLRDFVTDAPNVFVAGENVGALATTEVDARETLASADADAVGGTDTLAYATVDTTSDSSEDEPADALDALEARVRGVL